MKTLNKKEEDKTKEGNRKSEGNKNEETMKERNEEIFTPGRLEMWKQ